MTLQFDYEDFSNYLSGSELNQLTSPISTIQPIDFTQLQTGGAPRKKAAVAAAAVAAVAVAAAVIPVNPPNPKESESERVIIEMSAPTIDAATVIAKALYRKRKTMTELIIDQPLGGVVSLALLARGGFTSVETIRFTKPGTITEIKDIPHTVIRIFAQHNRIQTISNFPEGIEYIDLENNDLSGSVNISQFTALNYLNVSRNKITDFGLSDRGMPNTLKHLYANYNQITTVNLSGVPLLQTLDLEHNPNPSILDMPDTVTQLLLPPGSRQQSNTITPTVSAAVSDANAQKHREQLLTYLHIREQYYTKLHALRKRNIKTQVQPQCLGCKRNVGMIFSSRNQKYSAVCGSSVSPCGWNMVVLRGDFHPIRNIMHEMQQTVQQTRDHIIRQKMDTLFEYITEEKSADLFQQHIGFYRTSTELAEKYTKLYESANFNEAKATIIAEKQRKIQNLVLDVEEQLTAGNFAEAARIQSEEIAPISRYIHSLRFETNEILTTQYDDGKSIQLIQMPAALCRTELNVGEPI